MAITLFGAVGVPTDNGTNTADPTAFANPPIASMAAGDLVCVYAYCRTASAAIAVSNTGGQVWYSPSSSAHNAANTTLSARFFWCRYNGTWSAAPSFSFGATTNNNVVMLVFRPTASDNHWGVDLNTGVFEDRTAAASFTLNGLPVSNPSTVSIAAWNTSDDNTWGTLTGAGWSKTGLSAQYRNTSGQDVSSSFAYAIQTTAAPTNNVTQTQLTLGNDAGIVFSVTFYEYDPVPLSAMHRNIEQPYFEKPTIVMGQTKGLRPQGSNEIVS